MEGPSSKPPSSARSTRASATHRPAPTAPITMPAETAPMRLAGVWLSVINKAAGTHANSIRRRVVPLPQNMLVPSRLKRESEFLNNTDSDRKNCLTNCHGWKRAPDFSAGSDGMNRLANAARLYADTTPVNAHVRD